MGACCSHADEEAALVAKYIRSDDPETKAMGLKLVWHLSGEQLAKNAPLDDGRALV